MILIFYTQLLSFSRATWVGFLMTMPFFYLLSSKHFAQGSSRTFMGDVIATAIGIFSFTLIQTFNIFHSSFKAGMAFVLVSSIAFIYTFFITRNELSDTLKIKQIISSLISIAILLSLSFNYIQGYSILAAYGLLAFFMFFATHLEGCYSRFVERFLLIVMFSHVQLSGRSLFDLTLHFSLGLTYFLIAQKGQKAIKRETKFWLLLFIFISGLAVMIPSIPSLLDQFSTFVLSNALFITLSLAAGLLVYGLFTLALIWGTRLLRSRKFQVAYFILSISLLSTVGIFHFTERSTKSPVNLANNQLAVAGTINKRSQSYGGQFENSARMSMWKSAIPWFKDYFIIGSGPDTVKYMYPVYRRSEYGLLEGGHNFTPDRLHNEYVNTLVTR